MDYGGVNPPDSPIIKNKKMSNRLNWEQLYTQGRCKDIGVPWTTEELQKIKEGVSVDELRGIDIEAIEKDIGNVTVEDNQDDKELEAKLRKLSRPELVSYASKQGIDNPIRKTSDVLVEMIKKNKEEDLDKEKDELKEEVFSEKEKS